MFFLLAPFAITPRLGPWALCMGLASGLDCQIRWQGRLVVSFQCSSSAVFFLCLSCQSLQADRTLQVADLHCRRPERLLWIDFEPTAFGAAARVGDRLPLQYDHGAGLSVAALGPGDLQADAGGRHEPRGGRGGLPRPQGQPHPLEQGGEGDPLSH